MTGNVAKIRTIEGKLMVEVRGRTAEILDLRRITVSCGLCGGVSAMLVTIHIEIEALILVL
jgi:hypothetical protein